MLNPSSMVVNLASESFTDRDYDNHPVAAVNDHEVRISVMTEAYRWHCHPDSGETFLSVEGGLLIHLDTTTIELAPGNLFTVRRGVRHRTRPVGARSVNLTFERKDAKTEALAPTPERTRRADTCSIAPGHPWNHGMACGQHLRYTSGKQVDETRLPCRYASRLTARSTMSCLQ